MGLRQVCVWGGGGRIQRTIPEKDTAHCTWAGYTNCPSSPSPHPPTRTHGVASYNQIARLLLDSFIAYYISELNTVYCRNTLQKNNIVRFWFQLKPHPRSLIYPMSLTITSLWSNPGQDHMTCTCVIVIAVYAFYEHFFLLLRFTHKSCKNLREEELANQTIKTPLK